MKQRKKYPKTATAFGVVAGALFISGFINFAFFFPAGFLGLIALIFALGPDQNYKETVQNLGVKQQLEKAVTV